MIKGENMIQTLLLLTALIPQQWLAQPKFQLLELKDGARNCLTQEVKAQGKLPVSKSVFVTVPLLQGSDTIEIIYLIADVPHGKTKAASDILLQTSDKNGW